MDLSTILGILAGIGLIIISILIGGNGLELYMDLPGFCIVVGGISASTLISYPLNEVISVLKVVMKVFKTNIKEPTILMIEMVHLASIAKKEGHLKLPDYAKRINDPFISKGIQMVADTIPREEIIRALNTEINITQERHKLGREIFQQMGKYGPAYGMIGTLIGLVQMLANLKEPDKVGPAMSVALLTTFYGAVIANLFCFPIANKLKRRSEQEYLNMEIAKESILSIESAETITLLEDKLSSFISRSLHQTLQNQKKQMMKEHIQKDETPNS
ncbi:MAG: MotA/TolQ/ExbB proton channel family protein [Candidatus Margulisbacteria bacterium]|nr:MotA/TolQ/ExbB proton channel family protein [Candidatus Margulisiibacteriota bacterium]